MATVTLGMSETPSPGRAGGHARRGKGGVHLQQQRRELHHRRWADALVAVQRPREEDLRGVLGESLFVCQPQHPNLRQTGPVSALRLDEAGESAAYANVQEP
jgi:hypothetical protein